MNRNVPPRPTDRKIALLAGAGALAVFLTTLAPGLTWDHYGDDGGELTIALSYLGVPHPSGYPFYLLLGRFFCLIPIGDMAYRANLLSAFGGALAASAAALAALVLDRRLSLGLGPWACGILGLAGALGKTLWSQSLITEVYSLSTGLTLFSLALILKWHESQLSQPSTTSRTSENVGSGRGGNDERADLFLFRGFAVFGCSLGVHLTSAFLFPGILLLVLITDKYAFRKRIFWYSVAVLTGTVILLYGLLPILAVRNVPANWGLIRGYGDFIDHVSGAQYRYRMFAFTVRQLVERGLEIFLPLFRGQWGPATFFFIIAGMLVASFSATYASGKESRRSWRRLGTVWLVLFAPQFAYILNYNIEDLPPYFCLGFNLMGVFALFSIAGFIGMLNRAVPPDRWRKLATAAIFLIPFVEAVAHLPKMNLRNSTLARSFGEKAFRDLPRGSLILSDYDGKTNALLYQRWVVHPERDDVVVILRTMLPKEWYREHLRRIHPGLQLSEPSRTSHREWDELADHVSLRIFHENASRPIFLVKDHPQLTEGKFLEMSNGIFRLRSTPPRFDPASFGPRFARIDISEACNSDYRGDPFRPGLRRDDHPHFPFIGEGLWESRSKVPFWFLGPSSRTGKPSVISTCYQQGFSARLPLVGSESTRLHLAGIGGVTQKVSGPVTLLRVVYSDGEGPWEKVERIPDFRDSPTEPLRTISIPMDPGRTPSELEILGGSAVSPEGFHPGIAVFGITQELVIAQAVYPSSGGILWKP